MVLMIAVSIASAASIAGALLIAWRRRRMPVVTRPAPPSHLRAVPPPRPIVRQLDPMEAAELDLDARIANELAAIGRLEGQVALALSEVWP